MRRAALAAGFLLVVAAGCTGGTGSVELRVADGRTLTYETRTEIEKKGAIGAESRQTISASWTMRFAQRKGGGFDVRVQAASLDIEGTMDRAAAERLRSAAEKIDLVLTIDERGGVIAFSEPGSVPTDSEMASALTASFRTIGPLGVSLPQGPLGPGAKWTKDVDLVQLLPAAVAKEAEGSYQITHEFLGNESVSGREAAKISTKGIGTLGRSITVQGQKVDVEGTITSEGTAWIDRRTGLLLKQSTKGSSRLVIGGLEVTQTDQGEAVLASAPE